MSSDKNLHSSRQPSYHQQEPYGVSEKEKKTHKASVNHSVRNGKKVCCINCNQQYQPAGLARHLKYSKACYYKYERMLSNENERNRSVLGVDNGNDCDNYDQSQGEMDVDYQQENIDDDLESDSSWIPPLVKRYNAKSDIESKSVSSNQENGPTAAYIEVQENFLSESFSSECLPSVLNGNLNELLKEIAKDAHFAGKTAKSREKQRIAIAKDKVYGALSKFQYESTCNGDQLLGLIKLVIEYSSVVVVPERFRTISKWMEKKSRIITPEPDVIEVPMPDNWNIQNWPKEAGLSGPVKLIVNDPIALLAMKLIHPRTWGLWGSEIKYEKSFQTKESYRGESSTMLSTCHSLHML
jgi:hypothetical protein